MVYRFGLEGFAPQDVRSKAAMMRFFAEYRLPPEPPDPPTPASSGRVFVPSGHGQFSSQTLPSSGRVFITPLPRYLSEVGSLQFKLFILRHSPPPSHACTLHASELLPPFLPPLPLPHQVASRLSTLRRQGIFALSFRVPAHWSRVKSVTDCTHFVPPPDVPPSVSPSVHGFCYLAFLLPRFWRLAALSLGPEPRLLDLLSFCRRYPRFTIPRFSSSFLTGDVFAPAFFSVASELNGEVLHILGFGASTSKSFFHQSDLMLRVGSAWDEAVMGLRGASNITAIESKINSQLSDALGDAIAICPWFLPKEVQPYADQFSIPWSQSLVRPHSHPVHAAYRNILHSRVLPDLLHDDTTVVFCKDSRFAMLVKATEKKSLSLTLRNCVVSPRDLSRYAADSLATDPLNFPEIDTPSLLISEALHYFSFDDVYEIFRRNAGLRTLVGTSIVPLESLTCDYSLHPDLYRFAKKGNNLLYLPERDVQNPYVQPISGALWNTTSHIVGPDFVLAIELVQSAGPFHTFIVARAPLLVPTVRSYATAGFMPIPKTRRWQPDVEAPVPVMLFRSLVFYALSLTKYKRRDLMAKLRQFKGVLDDPALPLHVMISLVDCVEVLLSNEVLNSADHRFYTSLAGLIRYKTIGTLKRITLTKISQRYINRFLAALSDSDVITFPLGRVTVGGGPRDITFERNGLETNVITFLEKLRHVFRTSSSPEEGAPTWFKHPEAAKRARAAYAAELIAESVVPYPPPTVGPRAFENLGLSPISNDTPFFVSPPTVIGAWPFGHLGPALFAASSFDSVVAPFFELPFFLSDIPVGPEAPAPHFCLDVSCPICNDNPLNVPGPAVPRTPPNTPVSTAPPSPAGSAHSSPSPSPPTTPPTSPPRSRVNSLVSSAGIPPATEDYTVASDGEAVERPRPAPVPLVPTDPRVAAVLNYEVRPHPACHLDGCLEHAGAPLNVCSAGQAYNGFNNGFCHFCRDEIPEGGAGLDVTAYTTNIVVRASGASRSIRFGLPAREYLDQLFPFTQTKRFNPSFAGHLKPALPTGSAVPSVHCQPCLLDSLTVPTGRSPLAQWANLFLFSNKLTRPALMEPGSMLNVGHLEVLCLFYRIHVRLECPKKALKGYPAHYGVDEGPEWVIRWNGSDHFSFHEVDQVRARNIPFPTRRLAPASPRSLELKRALPVTFVPYTANWRRAEAYVRCLRDGSTGTLLHANGEEYVRGLEDSAEMALTSPRKEVDLAVVLGDAGSGKSHGVLKVLKEWRYHVGNVFTFVAPTTVLRDEVSKKLDLAAKKGPHKKGTPSYFCETFEVALKQVCEVLVVDELSKYPPGWLDLFIGLNPNVHTVVALGDVQQTVWHEPKECVLNNKDVYKPELDYLSAYATRFVRGTHRMSIPLANFFNTPTTSHSRAGLRFRPAALPEVFAITASRKGADDAAALLGLESCTINSAQGLTRPEIQVIIDRSVLTFPSSRALYTALSRSAGAVYIIFDFVPDALTVSKIATNPILSYLWSLRNCADDEPVMNSPLRMDDLFETELRDIKCPLQYNAPVASYTNFADIHHSPHTVPSGGAVVEHIYEEFSQPLTMWTNLEDVSVPEPPVEEPELLEPYVRAHAPLALASGLKEWVDGQVPERYEQELVGRDGRVSLQKDDGIQLRADWVERAKVAGVPLYRAMDDPAFHVDKSYLAPYHQMTPDDTTAFWAGVKKRITFDNPWSNLKRLQRARAGMGNHLWASLQGLIPRLKDDHPLLPGLVEECILENERNRVEVKGAKNLQSFRDRSEPEWDIFKVNLAAKKELKAKDETRFAGAKPLQTLITAHDYILHRLGWVARYITKKILSVLPAHIMLYLTKSPADLDAFCKRFWSARQSSWNDFTAFDQGQDASFLAMEVNLMEKLNIPSSEIAFYIHLKTHTYSNLGSFSIMRFTGEVFTFIFNSLANMAISNLRFVLDRSSKPICFGGDDSCFNYVPHERPQWSLLSPHLTLQFKFEMGDRPAFVSWFLTPHGIYKSPLLLWTRLQARIATGKLREVLYSYLYEFSFGYRMGDRIFDYLSPIESDAHSLTSRFFHRQKHLPKGLLYAGLDHVMASPRWADLYSTPAADLAQQIDSTPYYRLNHLLSNLLSALVPASVNAVFTYEQEPYHDDD